MRVIRALTPDWSMLRLIGVFAQANLGLTAALVAGATLTGILMPGFVLADGALADAVRAGGPRSSRYWRSLPCSLWAALSVR